MNKISLVNCIECGHSISSQAPRCPNPNCPNPQYPFGVKCSICTKPVSFTKAKTSYYIYNNSDPCPYEVTYYYHEKCIDRYLDNIYAGCSSAFQCPVCSNALNYRSGNNIILMNGAEYCKFCGHSVKNLIKKPELISLCKLCGQYISNKDNYFDFKKYHDLVKYVHSCIIGGNGCYTLKFIGEDPKIFHISCLDSHVSNWKELVRKTDENKRLKEIEEYNKKEQAIQYCREQESKDKITLTLTVSIILCIVLTTTVLFISKNGFLTVISLIISLYFVKKHNYL